MNGQSKQPHLPVWTMALLVAGNAIGAGILGLPIKTGIAGAVPSLAGMLLIWTLMLATGWIIAKQIIHSNCITSDLPTLFEKELGICGKWLSIIGYFIVLYGVLTAYLACGSSILVNLIPLPVSKTIWLLIFFAAATGLTIFGLDLVRRANAVLMFLLCTVFIFLLLKAGENLEISRFTYTDWHFMPCAFPIIICAFSFHNIIPTVCKGLKLQSRAIWKALLIGAFLVLCFNILWSIAIIGALPLDGQNKANILYALHQNLPATIPLSNMLHSNLVMAAGTIFALLAISTSYLAAGTSLMSFLKDLTTPYIKKNNRFINAGLTFGPPLAVVLIYPNLFLKALDLAGGVGILLVFGVLPSLIAIKLTKRGSGWLRLGSYALTAVFILLLILELAQEFGLLRIHPNIEYWHSASSAGKT